MRRRSGDMGMPAAGTSSEQTPHGHLVVSGALAVRAHDAFTPLTDTPVPAPSHRVRVHTATSLGVCAPQPVH